MTHQWKPYQLRLFLDISTYCNAGCPQCHRTSRNGLGKVDWLPLIQWSLKDFKKAFPPKELNYIKEFHLCGTWGDPIMNKDIVEICEYIIKHNKIGLIIIDTNGSIRSEEWWWKFGTKIGSRLMVKFDIDGINQEMHSKYRRFTDLNKILNNMYTLSMTKVRVKSKTVIFKHNENYKKEIVALTKKYGSSHHGFVNSNRSFKDGYDFFINENGENEFLQQATKINNVQKKGKILCRWASINKVVINPDGQVLPCCYHANNQYKRLFNDNMSKWPDITHEIYRDDYHKNLKSYNVFYTPLTSIIESKWYTQSLPNSIKSNNPIQSCVKHCSL